MTKLLILNFSLIAVMAVLLWCIKKFVKTERARNGIFIFSAFLTIAVHYSSFLYRLVFAGGAMAYLSNNPNLVLPIYPCNLVMWLITVYSLLKNKESKFARFIVDYVFWFGLISTLVGMFANVDFILNPTLRDYEILKSILAHATLLFNLLLLPVYGRIKVELKTNMLHIIYSILLMLGVGFYCNLLIATLVSVEQAYYVNSMFLIHSPFDGVAFLTYPIIALIAIPLYFALFTICELFAYEKGNRFYDRYRKK